MNRKSKITRHTEMRSISHLRLEIMLLRLVLERYEADTNYSGEYSIASLSKSYGKEVDLSQLVRQHLFEIEKYYGYSDTEMSTMFGLVLERTSDDFFRQTLSLRQKYDVDDIMHSFSRAPSLLSVLYGDRNDVWPYYLIDLEYRLLKAGEKDTIMALYPGLSVLWLTNLLANSSLFSRANGKRNSRSPRLLLLYENDNSIESLVRALRIINRIPDGTVLFDGDEWPINSEIDEADRVLINWIRPDRLSKDYDAFITDAYDDEMASLGELFPASQALAYLKEGGTAVVLCNISTLYKTIPRVMNGREALLLENYLDAVIELPSFYTRGIADKAALLILKKEKPHGERDIVMINAVAMEQTLREDRKRKMDDNHEISLSEWIASIYEESKNGDERFRKDVSPADITQHEYNFRPSFYMRKPAEQAVPDIPDDEELLRLWKKRQSLLSDFKASDKRFREIVEWSLGGKALSESE